MESQLESKRQQLITSLRAAGIYDEHVLTALAMVPRELFLDASLQSVAYDDRAQTIGHGQTISQPLIVATMTQALRLQGTERVLEVGTGSGYQTAVLAHLGSYVYSIERHQELAALATQRLQDLALTNVSISVGDGSTGWPAKAPFNRILVAAASPIIPVRLILQLTPGGLLTIPVGERAHQNLLLIRRTRKDFEIQDLGPCVFVPLVGSEGWQDDGP